MPVSEDLSDADRIRQEMVRVRSELHGDVEEVVASARALTDWRQYVRTYPWICLGAAAMAGYWLVPARRSLTAIEADRPKSKTAATKEAAVESGVKAGAAAGILGSLVSTAGTMALRGAMNFASRKATEWIDAKLQGPPQRAPRQLSSAPLGTPDGPTLYYAPGRQPFENDV